MAAVYIIPLPEAYREIPADWRPRPPACFPEGEATREDIILAVALIEALDADSQRWYRTMLAGLRAKLLADA
jgi:hypothetical protein